MRTIAKCDNAKTLLAAEEALASAVRQQDLPRLQKALKDPNASVRAAVIGAWATLKKQDAKDDLKKWLTSDDADIRAAAARALVRMGEPLD